MKCALFTFEHEPREVARTTIDCAGAAGRARVADWVAGRSDGATLATIGHRIVHGGARFREPTRVSPALVGALRELVPFAPNHLPDEIALIDALRTEWPDVPQIACFDTAFHADLPDVARTLPIPRAYAADGVRRYGFHGLSFTFLVQELQRSSGSPPERVVLAHLGNGSSLAAVRRGRSIDTTMAFTPIGGVVMSTRSGDLDPGVITFIARRDRLNPDQLEDLLSHQSGLLGVSDGTSDMRGLLERETQDAACALAVAMYVYSVKKAIGSLAAALGGLDAIVFSGGIGEHSATLRRRICDGLQFLGVEITDERNAAHGRTISAPAARVAVHVIPTNEEIVIARSAYAIAGPR